MLLRRLSPLALVAFLAACSRSDDPRPRGTPPPPPQALKPAACAAGGGKLADTISAPFFPTAPGGFCLDPNGGDKSYGEAATQPLDGICTHVFDGECEIYKGYGVRRVVEARYVDGSGTAATIEVYLSRFGTTEGAYAMFTRRVVGDGDPADDATPRPVEGGGSAALGIGNAYLWRGLYLAEITYSDETSAEAAIKAAGAGTLPGFVKEMGAKLPGDTALPPAAASLPTQDLLPLGIRFMTKDLLGVEGTGAGVFGYYRAGAKRWRVASMLRADEDQAKDVLTTLAKLPGAAKEKTAGETFVRAMRKEGESPAAEWIFARAGKRVLGVGDEVRVLRSGMTAEQHAAVSLTKEDKLDRLKKLLAP